jgi:hypothetical protein
VGLAVAIVSLIFPPLKKPPVVAAEEEKFLGF